MQSRRAPTDKEVNDRLESAKTAPRGAAGVPARQPWAETLRTASEFGEAGTTCEVGPGVFLRLSILNSWQPASSSAIEKPANRRRDNLSMRELPFHPAQQHGFRGGSGATRPPMPAAGSRACGDSR